MFVSIGFYSFVFVGKVKAVQVQAFFCAMQQWTPNGDFDEYLKVLGLQTLIMQTNVSRTFPSQKVQEKHPDSYAVNRTPNTKAQDYMEALADFRKDDDVFIPMDSLSSNNAATAHKAADEMKAVGSRVLFGTSIFDYADFGAHHLSPNCTMPQPNHNVQTYHRAKSNFPREVSAKPMDYATVTKLPPSHFKSHIAGSGVSSTVLSNRTKVNDTNVASRINPAKLSSTADQMPSRVRTLNGATIVNGINLNNLKFVKPAPQCVNWNEKRHRIDQPNCRLWHPRELCKYYPNCTLTADVCGFGHPFCGEYCRCDPNKRSLQENHRFMPLHLQEAMVYMKPGNNNKTSKTPHRA
ncbi:hypothetical protein Ddc_01062 [Ditylenchus destructor]|nr:hypothetical protein Ddc_01062 [Ditylenchus destructor]